MDTRSIVWIDATGNRTITRVNTASGAGSIMTSAILCSTGDFLEYWESAVTTNGAPAPPGGQYQPVSQRAVLTFICADTTQVAVIIPSPAVAIFKADQETVDPTNIQVAALIANCIGVLVSSTGSPATAYVSGILAPLSRSPL